MKIFKDTSMLFLVAALLSAVWTGMCVADDFPSLELRLETQRQELLPGESVTITLEITNTGTKDTRRLNFVAPGSRREFKFTWSDAQGREIKARVNEGTRPEGPLKPGESYTSRINLTNTFHFTDRTRPGKYALWVEYIPERQWKNTETPVLARSNVLEFDVRAPAIIEEKSEIKKFLDLGYDGLPREKKFKVFVHRGRDSNRLYWARFWGLKDEDGVWPYIKIADNVKPGSFDMVVDDYGNTHVWYQTANGDFHRFTMWNDSKHYPETPFGLGEKEWKDLDDVPEGRVPRFNVKEGRVEIKYVPAPPEDTDGEEPRLHPPVRIPPPSPFLWYLIIIGAVVVIGAMAAGSVIHFRRKR